MKSFSVYLCEVTYSKTLQALRKRLKAWDSNWVDLKLALERDCGITQNWSVEPWLFIPQSLHEKISSLSCTANMPQPRVTYLESVAPWNYEEENRIDDRLEYL